MLHDFFAWLQYDLGKRAEDGTSWSQQLGGSLNLWNIFEGTHVLTLIFFAGTIWIIDLRMMGVAFRNVPFSRLNDRVLPITIAAFAVMVITGVITLLGRDPMTLFYHDIWFRLKMIFLLIATINIFWFHYQVQKSQAEWDADPTPPARVRISGAISMTCWILVIIFGRFIAYDWYRCEKVEPGSFVYIFAECELLYRDSAEEEDAVEEEAVTDDPPAEETAPAEGETPTDESPPDPSGEAPTNDTTPGEEG